jgi:tetratricopeptide (TPR) repeat protein
VRDRSFSLDFATSLLAVVCSGMLASVAVQTRASANDQEPSRETAARKALLAGRADEAAGLYAALLEANPTNGEAVEGRVRALIALDRHVEALSEARKRHAAQPESPLVVSALGEAMFRAGLLEDVDALLQPLVGDPHAPVRSLLVLGRLRGAQGRRTESRELLRRALQAAPQDRDVLFWAAESAATRGETIDLLERFLFLAEGANPDRAEAARGTVRMLRELGEREIWVPERRPEQLEAPLRRLRASDGRTIGFVVKVGLGDGGKSVRLLLDTGSSGLFLVDRIAKKRGFVPVARETFFGGGGDQRHPSPRGLFSQFDLGGLGFSNALATTTEQEFEERGRVQGVLGIHIFEGYRVTLDLQRGRLVLDQEPSGDEGVPYWTFSGQMLVRAAANETHRGLFLFDTGATSTLLSATFAAGIAEARFREPAQVVGFGGRREGARYVGGVNVGFEGLVSAAAQLPTADLGLRSDLTGVEISGYLGLDLLDRSCIRVDTRTRRVSCNPAPG